MINAIRRRSPINPYTGKRIHKVSVQEYGNIWSEEEIKTFVTDKDADKFIEEYAKQNNLEIIPPCGGYFYPKRHST